MKSLRHRILVLTTLTLAVLGANAIPAAAQADLYKGSFTLPVAAEWPNTRLPAGHYTFSMKSVDFPVRIRVEGENGTVYVVSVGTSQRDSGDNSFLILEQRGDSKFVRELYLAQIGLHVRYYVPAQSKEDLLAKGPAKTERVSILAASN